MRLLGIDNVLLSVGQLDSAIAHYAEGLGFALKFRMDAKGIAILAIGEETPGLVLREERERKSVTDPFAPRLWVEVADAKEKAQALESGGITLLSPPFMAGTGWVVEVADEWGNVVGFTDYSVRPELGRKNRA
ncbi:VOC family protein [Cohnella massiliensis]|jgi:predicted enzyme related to lactoylglutathione lyase|uniref:VOC family protein n=1 Tax=Cohnella massiliensis TaxID=1816691 RepID=UPI0009BB0455|nr:VOC family protein [Cohnella massiliensis]